MIQVLKKSKIMQNNEGKIYKRSTKLSKKYYQTYVYIPSDDLNGTIKHDFS